MLSALFQGVSGTRSWRVLDAFVACHNFASVRALEYHLLHISRASYSVILFFIRRFSLYQYLAISIGYSIRPSHALATSHENPTAAARLLCTSCMHASAARTTLDQKFTVISPCFSSNTDSVPFLPHSSFGDSGQSLRRRYFFITFRLSRRRPPNKLPSSIQRSTFMLHDHTKTLNCNKQESAWYLRINYGTTAGKVG